MPISGTAFFMLAYIDESGDTGWEFNYPYRNGGSSRYLTVSCLLVPENLKQHPKRIVRDVYTKFSIPTTNEIKGYELSDIQRTYFINKVIKMLIDHPEIEVFVITVYKPNVLPHIQRDSNKLYNYMVKLLLLDRIKREREVTLIPDPRSIKVRSGNSMIDYLQTELWFTANVNTVLSRTEISSDKSLNLQFIDFISNIFWRAEEINKHSHALKLQKSANRNVHVKYLFYPKP